MASVDSYVLRRSALIVDVAERRLAVRNGVEQVSAFLPGREGVSRIWLDLLGENMLALDTCLPPKARHWADLSYRL